MLSSGLALNSDKGGEAHSADRGTQFALSWAIVQFWRNCELETDEALKLAGFCIEEEA